MQFFTDNKYSTCLGNVAFLTSLRILQKQRVIVTFEPCDDRRKPPAVALPNICISPWFVDEIFSKAAAFSQKEAVFSHAAVCFLRLFRQEAGDSSHVFRFKNAGVTLIVLSTMSESQWKVEGTSLGIDPRKRTHVPRKKFFWLE